MNLISKIIILPVLVIVITSCNTQNIRSASSPDLVAVKEPRPFIPPPTSPQLPAWKGIPIIPNAKDVQCDREACSFKVFASIKEVQYFYESEMAKTGRHELPSGPGEINAIVLVFMNDTDIVAVSISAKPQGMVYIKLLNKIQLALDESIWPNFKV